MKPTLALSANARLRAGGQGLNLYHMLTGFRAHFDVTVYCRGTADDQNCRVMPASWRAAAMGRIPIMRRWRHLQGYFDDVDYDRAVAARLTPATLFQGVTGQCWDSLQVARKQGARTILDSVTCHVDTACEAMDRSCEKFKIAPPLHQWTRRRMREEYQTADLIRVMSEVARQTFIARGVPDEKLVVVPPPLAEENFPQVKADPAIFRVAFVGLIEPWKGFDDLVSAFERLGLPESELTFWGGTGSRPVARYFQEAMARNPRIRLCPVAVRDVGFAKVFDGVSVLVHPSLTDGFGYSAGEAMACGVPVIATRQSGVADWINDGENGFLMDAGDVDGLTDRLAHLARHPELVVRVGQAARASAAGLDLARFRGSIIPRVQRLGIAVAGSGAREVAQK